MFKLLTLVLLISSSSFAEVRINTNNRILQAAERFNDMLRDFSQNQDEVQMAISKELINEMAEEESYIIDGNGKKYLLIDTSILSEIVIDKKSSFRDFGF